MPPKKAVSRAAKAAAQPVSARRSRTPRSPAAAKPASASKKAPAPKAAKPVKTPTKTLPSRASRAKPLVNIPSSSMPAPAAKKTAAKRKASTEVEDEPQSKRAKKILAAPKAPVKRGRKPAAKNAVAQVPKQPAKRGRKPAAKQTAAKRKASTEVEDEPQFKKAKKNPAASKAPAKSGRKPAAAKAVVAEPKKPAKRGRKSAAEKQAAAPKPASKPRAPRKVAPPKPKKQLPILNNPPTTKLDVYVFGEGGAGELGLGYINKPGKSVIDVKRPRLNELLAASTTGVVQVAVGGMHCAALTHDNKILTWGVNDDGALGRVTSDEGKLIDADAEDIPDSDSVEGDSGLNPTESTPGEVDPSAFPEDTKFAALFASDNCTFALTTIGTVYGWGTFRNNEGPFAFTDKVDKAFAPMLIPQLNNIVDMACGVNHVIAIDNKGKAFTWGAGEQSQLARRVVARTARGALIPREFGLSRKVITRIGAGDYHSFAVDQNGNVYGWGLNTFQQTGVPKKNEADDTVIPPQLVPGLSGYRLKQIVGGAHHTLALSEEGELIALGRVDNYETGLDLSSLPETSVFKQDGQPRYLTVPVHVTGPGRVVSVGTANDTGVCVNEEGKAYSFGFSDNYQTAQGSAEVVEEAELIDNNAVRGKKLVFAGVGGQFGLLAGEPMEE